MQTLKLDVPWRTLVRIAAVVGAVWIWLRLWQLAMALVVSIVVAVALHPIVEWLEERQAPRWLAATVPVLMLAGLIALFVTSVWNTIASQAHVVGASLSALEVQVRTTVPMLSQALGNHAATDQVSLVREYGREIATSALRALLLIALGLVLTVYLLIEREKTQEWVIVFVPPAHRARARRTMSKAYEVVLAYARGNAATSVFAAVTVYAALTLLGVPAALLLALLAGLFDFVPVLGFIVSALPALMLASTVSTPVVVAVASVYIGYHFLENYVIGPRVYGEQLRLSNVAVIVAFAAGAELGGVIGALLALPIAAIYPVVECIWFTGEAREVAVRHDRLNHEEPAERAQRAG